MNCQEIQEYLNSKFPGTILGFGEKNPQRLYVDIDPAGLRDMARELFAGLKCRFAIASGVQTLAGFQILYHFSLDRTGVMISLRVKLGKENPAVDSIADLVPAADWIEREMHELLGISFRGRPELERLLLGEEWPEGVYPLRKDFSGLAEEGEKE